MNPIYTCCYLVYTCDASNFNLMISIIKSLKKSLKEVKKKEYEGLFNEFYDQFADKRVPRNADKITKESIKYKLAELSMTEPDCIWDYTIASDYKLEENYEHYLCDGAGYNLIYAEPILSIPKDLKVFYKFNNGFMLKNGTSFNLSRIMNVSEDITSVQPNKIKVCPFDELDNTISDTQKIKFIIIHVHDWYTILDEGNGELAINLNKNSDFYGNILSYSSYKGALTYVAKSFSEFVKIMLQTNAEYIKSLSYFDTSSYIEGIILKEERFCERRCAMISDHFNYHE